MPRDAAAAVLDQMLPPLLTPQDLADLCQVPVSTVYGWNSKGLAPPRLHVGKYVRYRQPDVNQWLAAQAAEVA